MPKTVVASGHFDCAHGGHLDMLEAARALGDRLVVIVNNDDQCRLKKGFSLLDERTRLRLVGALRCVDLAVLSVDEDRSVCRTLRLLHFMVGADVFANGGDVSGEGDCREAGLCRDLGIELVFGVGGAKSDSSSAILSRALGYATPSQKPTE